MKLLIVEPTPDGHHFVPYLLFFAREAMARGFQVRLLTTASATRHPAFGMLRDALGGDLRVSLMPEIPQARGRLIALVRRQLDYRKSVAAGFASIERKDAPDHVFALSMDGMDRAVALLGSPFGTTPFSGLFVHLKFHWASLGVAPSGRFPWLQQRLLSRLLGMRKVHAMASIDESLPGWWAQRHPGTAHKLKYVPDPGQVHLREDKGEARSALGIQSGAFVLLVYGLMSASKNVLAMLRAIIRMEGEGVAVVAGRADVGTLSALASPEFDELRATGCLRVIDNFIDLDLEQRLFAAADAVWLGYASFVTGQSAVLAQAASAGLPVIAREGGWIGWMTQRHGLGLCVDPADTGAVVAAVDRLRSDPVIVATVRDAALRFSVARSEAAFASAIMACIPDPSRQEDR